MWGDVSAPVTRSTSAAPNARGAGSSCWTNWENLLPKGEEGPPPRCLPQAIMMAPARMFSCLSMPSSSILEQSNPLGTSGLLKLVIILFFCCACAMLAASAENAPKPTSARKTPARTINRPIKTRRLKKADCEADFFFMDGFQADVAVLVFLFPLAFSVGSERETP